jgi:hypothetical protein
LIALQSDQVSAGHLGDALLGSHRATPSHLDAPLLLNVCSALRRPVQDFL